MKTFDLFLVPREGESVEPETLLECLGEIPQLLSDPADPSRLYYTNEHSGVRFFLLIDEQYLPTPTDDEEYAYDYDGSDEEDLDEKDEEYDAADNRNVYML